jgi:hypothetical protein
MKNPISSLTMPLTVCNTGDEGLGRFTSDLYLSAEMSIPFLFIHECADRWSLFA